MALLWPWSVVHPLNPLYAAEYFDTFFEKPWKELYEGRLIAVPDMPASYLPHLFVLKLPLLLLVLGLAGAVGAFFSAARRDTPPNRRAVFLLAALAALLPIGIAMLTRPALYNGLRHFIFVVPPFAALGGLAVAWLAARAQVRGKAALAAIVVAGLAVPVAGMARLHPYEYAYFNPLAGGVRGVQDKYMLDYWGLAFKQAADELRAQLAATRTSRKGGAGWWRSVGRRRRPHRTSGRNSKPPSIRRKPTLR